MNDRPNNMRIVFLVVLALGILLALQASRRKGFVDKIPWRTNLDTAVSEAKTGNKPLLLEFSTSWCVFCEKMSADTFSDAKVQKLLENYIPVRLDGDASPELVQKFQVQGYPGLRVVDAELQTLKAVDGYLDAPSFLQWMGK